CDPFLLGLMVLAQLFLLALPLGLCSLLIAQPGLVVAFLAALLGFLCFAQFFGLSLLLLLIVCFVFVSFLVFVGSDSKLIFLDETPVGVLRGRAIVWVPVGGS